MDSKKLIIAAVVSVVIAIAAAFGIDLSGLHPMP